MPIDPDQEPPSERPCWCCGATYRDAELIRLGRHPEFLVCLDCVRSLHRRAAQRHDEQHPSLAGLARHGVQTVRNTATLQMLAPGRTIGIHSAPDRQAPSLIAARH